MASHGSQPAAQRASVQDARVGQVQAAVRARVADARGQGVDERLGADRRDQEERRAARRPAPRPLAHLSRSAHPPSGRQERRRRAQRHGRHHLALPDGGQVPRARALARARDPDAADGQAVRSQCARLVVRASAARAPPLLEPPGDGRRPPQVHEESGRARHHRDHRRARAHVRRPRRPVLARRHQGRAQAAEEAAGRPRRRPAAALLAGRARRLRPLPRRDGQTLHIPLHAYDDDERVDARERKHVQSSVNHRGRVIEQQQHGARLERAQRQRAVGHQGTGRVQLRGALRRRQLPGAAHLLLAQPPAAATATLAPAATDRQRERRCRWWWRWCVGRQRLVVVWGDGIIIESGRECGHAQAAAAATGRLAAAKSARASDDGRQDAQHAGSPSGCFQQAAQRVQRLLARQPQEEQQQ